MFYRGLIKLYDWYKNDFFQTKTYCGAMDARSIEEAYNRNQREKNRNNEKKKRRIFNAWYFLQSGYIYHFKVCKT